MTFLEPVEPGDLVTFRASPDQLLPGVAVVLAVATGRRASA
jgi:acyl-coenzyme A thioesterase PaaI-like protein